MPKADTSVKWFHSDMADAPLATSAPGALVAILDACLRDGFCVRAADSIAVSGEVATINLSSGNPYEKHTVVSVSGASIPALNGEWKVATSGAVSLTFECPGVADGVASGASVRFAPAGWSTPFSDGNKRAYQSSDLASTQLYLRVDNSGPQCPVRGYEQMTAIDDGAGMWPTTTSHADWYWWAGTTPTPVAWELIADGSIFYFTVALASQTTTWASYMFGDIVPTVPSDRYGCLLSAISWGGTSASTMVTQVNSGVWNSATYSTVGQPRYPRLLDQVTKSTSGVCFISGGASPATGVAGQTPYPGIIGGIFFSYPVYALNQNQVSSEIRGELPGAVHISSSLGMTRPVLFVEDGHPLPGRTLRLVRFGPGTAAFDITGPWR